MSLYARTKGQRFGGKLFLRLKLHIRSRVMILVKLLLPNDLRARVKTNAVNLSFLALLKRTSINNFHTLSKFLFLILILILTLLNKKQSMQKQTWVKLTLKIFRLEIF